MLKSILALSMALLGGALGCASGAHTLPKMPSPQIPSRSFKIADFGAIGDGKTSNTKAFADAIEERVRQVHGEIEVVADDDHGTAVRVTLPAYTAQR